MPASRVRRIGRGLALVTLLGLAGCGGDGTGPSEPALTGNWAGTISASGGTADISMSLNELNGKVSGTGELSGADTVPLTINGTHRQQQVSLTISSAGFAPIQFVGSADQGSMTGTLNGSGFVDVDITIAREQ